MWSWINFNLVKKLCFSWYDTSKELSFKITDTKLYVPVLTLSKTFRQLKSGLKITIKWNKYRSQMTVPPQNNNLNYLIDPTSTNVNSLFVLSFARNIIGDDRDSFSDYYVPNVEIKSLIS